MDNISKEILTSIINDYSENFPETMSKDTIFEYFTIENYFKDIAHKSIIRNIFYLGLN